MRKGYIKTQGGKICYSVYGEEQTGTPLLVLHGGPGFLSMPQVVSDLSLDRRVYFYDQLGCGESDRATDISFYSLENYIEELEEVRHKLNLNMIYLMGFSWGTALACSFMLKKKPQGIQGLILCGPYLSTSRWDADQRQNIACMSGKVRKAIEIGEEYANYGTDYQAAMMEYYRKYVCRLQPWPDFLQTAFSKLSVDVYQAMWGPSEFTISGTLKSLDLFSELSNIDIPVLLVCGDQDEAGVKTVKDYQMAFPNAQMAVIPNASHLHQIEQPEIFKCIVNKFLIDNV